MRSSRAAFVSQKSSKNGCAFVSRSRSSISPVLAPQRSQMYGQKDVSGMPPCRATSRYVSLHPSHGLMAARCGGFSSATRHWETVR